MPPRLSGRRESRRLLVTKGATLISFGILAFQLWNIQVANGRFYRQRAEYNRLRQVTRKPLRGVIYDRHGRQLVRNVPNFSVVIRPADLPRSPEAVKAMLHRLAAVLGTSADDLYARVEAGRANPYQPVRVQSYIGREAALILEEQRINLPGVTIQPTPMRQYLEGALLGNLLGYTGPIPPEQLTHLLAKRYERDDVVGLAGLEATMEADLRGTPGRLQVEVDAMGRTVKTLATLVAARPGHTVVLTIDTRLQRAVAKLLTQALIRTGAESGVAVVMRPQTGEVLALVSLPGYDNNLFAAGIGPEDYRRLREDERRPLVNAAIAGLFPPGSTFKIVSAAAALQERVITPDRKIVCRGLISLPGGYVFRDWLPKGHGPVDVVQALAQSCDVYFYTVADGWPEAGITGLGPRRVAQYARLFGFGAKTGIPIPGELPGLVPTPEWKQRVKGEPWYLGDSYNMGIGQGDLLTTPLQVLNALNAIANGGTLYRPQLIWEVRDPDGRPRRTFEPQIIRRLPIAPPYLALVRRGLREAVTSRLGTAHQALKDRPIAIAGKTGTAEAGGPPNARGQRPPHAWFVGYAPADNPAISALVLVQGGGEGSIVAAPITADIMEAYFTSHQPSAVS